MAKSSEIRQTNCQNLLRKYEIHDGIVMDKGNVHVIRVLRRIFKDTLWHIEHEYCVLNVNVRYSKYGATTEITVGIAK